jgi:hypothetical protein
MSRFGIWLGLSLLFASDVRLLFPAEREPALAGRVRSEGGNPLSRAVVFLQSLSDPSYTVRMGTDAKGIYSEQELPDGEYSIEASCPGFVSVRFSPVRVEFPRHIQRDFQLPVAPAEEGGIYTRAEIAGELKQKTGRVPHASICLTKGTIQSCTETNGLGQYFLAVEPGTYDVVVSVDGRRLWQGRLDLQTSREYRNQIRLD